jgi:hypothetical protein
VPEKFLAGHLRYGDSDEVADVCGGRGELIFLYGLLGFSMAVSASIGPGVPEDR